MMLLLRKYVNAGLIILTVPLILFLSCLLLLLPLAALTVSVSAFFADSGVEHAQTNQDCSISAALLSVLLAQI
jgi:hypothetical protein